MEARLIRRRGVALASPRHSKADFCPNSSRDTVGYPFVFRQDRRRLQLKCRRGTGEPMKATARIAVARLKIGGQVLPSSSGA
jgi:hypothetical protein